MERITGKQVQSMMEAVHQVYAPEDLLNTSAEKWVSLCIEKGINFEEYTLDQITEAFIVDSENPEILNEISSQELGAAARQKFGQARRAVGGALSSFGRGVADVGGAAAQGLVGQKTTSSNPLARFANLQNRIISTPARAAGSFATGFLTGKGSSTASAAPGKTEPPKPEKSKTEPPAQTVTTKNASGQQQQVTVGRKYDATLGGQKGTVTYDAAGKKTFTANKPTGGDTAPAKPTANTAVDKTTTPPAKPVPTGTTADGTKFERRLPTMAELKAAQAARKAAKKAGADRAGQEAAAVKGGVGVQQSIDAALKAARARDTAPAPAGSALAKQQQAQGRTVSGSGAMGSAANPQVRAQLGLKPINPQPAPVKPKQKPQV